MTDELRFCGHHVAMPYACFSSRYPSLFTAPATGGDDDDVLTFHTVEQYTLYRKARLFGDAAAAVYIMAVQAGEPPCGQCVRGFDRATWQANARAIVAEGCWHKFSQNPRIAQILLSTGDRPLVDASPASVCVDVGQCLQEVRRRLLSLRPPASTGTTTAVRRPDTAPT